MQDTYTVSGIRAAVAQAVRVELAKRNISASELARRAGLTQTSLSRRMTGTTAFDVDDLAKIAEVLELPLSALIPMDAPERAA